MNLQPADFGTLITAIPGLFLATFDTGKNLIYANTDMAHIFSDFFAASDYLDVIYTYAKDAASPYIVSNFMGLIWEAILEKKEGELQAVHVLGPVFYAPFSDETMEKILRSYEARGLSMRNKHVLLKQMRDLPVMNYRQFAHYAIMLHFICNRERVSVEDFHFLGDRTRSTPSCPGSIDSIRSHLDTIDADDAIYESVWQSETYFLREVSSGSPSSFQDVILHALRKGNLILMPTIRANIQEPDRLQKDMLLIFNALECRAAAEAGVLPATAYRTQDRFIEEIESLHSPLGLNDLQQEIHLSYCELVSDAKRDASDYSLPVRRCMDDLSQHPTDGFSSDRLSELSGYTPYYLSRLFKQETGLTPKEYFRKVKMEYAAALLRTTEENIHDISETLHYGSHTHFCKDFKQIFGCTPTQYRNLSRKPS